MRVFVTGATGFVGAHLVPRLVEDGHDVTCLVRPTSRTERLRDLGVRMVVGDVTDRASFATSMAGHDWLIHLANIYTFWEPDPSVYERVNVEGTRNVMEAALEASTAKVVHVSTMVVWGSTTERPFTEETPEGPERRSRYAESKYQGDRIAWELHRTRGLPLVVVHPAAILGEGDTKTTGRLVSDLLSRRLPALVCSDTRVTFVHVDDVVEAIVRAAEKPDDIGERYLVGKETLTIAEVTDLVCELGAVQPPRLSLPDPIGRLTASVLTGVADRIKRPPLWGLSRDYFSNASDDLWCDGSKAERELGICYTPLRTAILEEIEGVRGTSH